MMSPRSTPRSRSHASGLHPFGIDGVELPTKSSTRCMSPSNRLATAGSPTSKRASSAMRSRVALSTFSVHGKGRQAHHSKPSRSGITSGGRPRLAYLFSVLRMASYTRRRRSSRSASVIPFGIDERMAHRMRSRGGCGSAGRPGRRRASNGPGRSRNDRYLLLDGHLNAPS